MRSLPAFVDLDLLWWTGLTKLKASHIFHLKVISLKYFYAGCSGKRKLCLQYGNLLKRKDLIISDEFALSTRVFSAVTMMEKKSDSVNEM